MTPGSAATLTRCLTCMTGWRHIVVPGLAMMLSAVSVEVQAQPNGGYDPRTWHYDAVAGMVIPPSANDGASDYAPPPHWTPIPRVRVRFHEAQPAGSIVIDTGERRLYYVLGDGTALRYAVGVGREGFAWSGRDRISAKRIWPDWRPPVEMIRREAARGNALPAYVSGGPHNPLGARDLYIGSTLYRIHGTNQPWTVGTATSSGCIRMTNEDVIDLFERVQIGAQVIVRH